MGSLFAMAARASLNDCVTITLNGAGNCFGHCMLTLAPFATDLFYDLVERIINLRHVPAAIQRLNVWELVRESLCHPQDVQVPTHRQAHVHAR